jgi:general secretion pathway protein A
MTTSRLWTEPRPARALYAAHFGLAEAPFSIAPDPRYLFMSDRHREALAHLLYGVGEGGGFVQLTGEVGTGKTTVCRCLLAELPPHVDVALVLNPRLTAFELLATVCDELRISYARSTTSLKALVDALYQHLLTGHAAGRRTVLIIDEAQDLAPDVLEQIRLLTNLETDREKLLQIILIGQPELLELLERPDLRQLAQRVTARYHLLPFTERETREYIRHRLGVARGGDPAAGAGIAFTQGAVRRIHRAAGGIPRLINVICDRALLGAYAHDRRRIDRGTARRAAAEVLGASPPRAYGRATAWVAGGVLAAGLVALWVAGVPGRLRPVPAAAPGATVARAAPLAAPAADPGPPAAPSLTDLLADGTAAHDRPSALRRLYARWRPGQPAPETGHDCAEGRYGDLHCLARAGTWTKLRRLDVPAVLELAGPAGERRYATLTRLDAAGATLDLGRGPRTFSLDEVERHWDGTFVVLWKPPIVGRLPIQPGARGAEVLWLRRRLDGGTPPGGDPRLYDEDLKSRVVAFQEARMLAPDGLVGEETLAYLTLESRDPGVPTLGGDGS